VLAAAAAAALAGARVPLGAWAAVQAPPLAFVAAGVLPLLFTWGPDGFGIAAGGPAAAFAVAARTVAATAALTLLALTTPAPDLVRGLRRLGLAPELAELALTTWRFLFVLADTARTMNTAQAARLGHDGMRRTLRSTGLLAAALLPRAFDRAHRLETGLAARGFDGRLPTLAATPPASKLRLAMIVLVLAAIAGGGR
jgi:cobalt/nickel transport system permease protein